MSHKFRFSEKCIDRLKEYCGILDKSARSSKKQPARKKEQAAPKPPTTKKCPYCLSEIPIQATKCAHCTSELSE